MNELDDLISNLVFQAQVDIQSSDYFCAKNDLVSYIKSVCKEDTSVMKVSEVDDSGLIDSLPADNEVNITKKREFVEDDSTFNCDIITIWGVILDIWKIIRAFCKNNRLLDEFEQAIKEHKCVNECDAHGEAADRLADILDQDNEDAKDIRRAIGTIFSSPIASSLRKNRK